MYIPWLLGQLNYVGIEHIRDQVFVHVIDQ